MTFQDYVHIVRERWVLVLFGLLIGAGGAAAHTVLATPQYAAGTQFFIATPDLGSDPSLSQAYQGSLLSEQKIKSYTELATGRRIREAVSDELGSPVAPGVISAHARADTVLLTISVTDPSPLRAKRISDLTAREFVRLVDEVERPNSGQEPAVAARVVQAAEVPEEPVSPRPVRDVALGVIVGLMLGVGLAFGRHALDRSVKSADALGQLSGAPVLGVTTYAGAVRKAPLTMIDDPRSPLAESYRQLRTNLTYVDLDNTHKLIVVTSAVAGEGKTTTACNLALALAQSGTRVALVEADLRRPKAAEYLGLENAVGLTTVLTGRVELDQALQPWGRSGLDFLGSGELPPNPAELLSSRQMAELLADLGSRYDLVLLDAPPVLPVADAAALTAQCSGALLVARHGKASIDQVRTAVAHLHRVSGRVFGLILSMAPKSRRRNGYAYYYAAGKSAPPAIDHAEPPMAAAPTKRRRAGGRHASPAPSGEGPGPATDAPQSPAPGVPVPRAGHLTSVPASGAFPQGVSEVVVTPGRRHQPAAERNGA